MPKSSLWDAQLENQPWWAEKEDVFPDMTVLKDLARIHQPRYAKLINQLGRDLTNGMLC